MRSRVSKRLLGAVVGVVAVGAASANAAISVGAGGRGVTAGNSSLISAYDYQDTFTGSADGGLNPNRPYVAAIQAAPAYVVEKTFGHPSTNFTSPGFTPDRAEFSIAADGPGTPGLVNGSPNYPGTSGAGSATGLTQTGNSVDYSLPYGFRTKYVVQFDAVTSGDRIDMTTGSNLGGGIGLGNLSVFFRATGGLSLYNGATDTPVTAAAGAFDADTGLRGGGQWHNYAVLFDRDANKLQIFVDEASKGVIDLNTFAGGLYANFATGIVGAGGGLGGGENRTWTDNFQVGAPVVPEPATFGVIGIGAVGLLARRRRA